MQNTPFKTLFLAALLLAATVSAQAAPSKIMALMPRRRLHAYVVADGFPTRVPNASWRRVIQTGHYALAIQLTKTP
jgi:hypothetical protein